MNGNLLAGGFQMKIGDSAEPSVCRASWAAGCPPGRIRPLADLIYILSGATIPSNRKHSLMTSEVSVDNFSLYIEVDLSASSTITLS